MAKDVWIRFQHFIWLVLREKSKPTVTIIHYYPRKTGEETFEWETEEQSKEKETFTIFREVRNRK